MELQKLIDGLKAHKSGAASYESVDEAIRVFEAMWDVDAEKVVKGLQLTKSNPVEGWDYRGEGFDGAMVHTSTALIDAALALIRQQQERIAELEVGQTERLITEADFERADAWGIIPAWIEYRPELESAEDGWELIDCNVFHNVFKRAWTQRPTDEQRKAVKWE